VNNQEEGIATKTQKITKKDLIVMNVERKDLCEDPCRLVRQVKEFDS